MKEETEEEKANQLEVSAETSWQDLVTEFQS